MATDWRSRFIKAVEADGRTARAISKAAGLGPNYLTQMLSRGTAPSTPALVALCDVLGVSLTYIFTGAEMSPEEEELLRLSAELTDEQKKLLIELARQMPSGGQR
jgi:transcriptional regulator with XRE-family HTH domain